MLTRTRDKENDLTWLYGPLLTHEENTKKRTYDAPSPSISVASSATGKKSILKRKTISQAILQHSLTTNSLLKRAGAIIKAQNASGHRASSDTSTSQTRTESVATLTSGSSVTSESPSSVVRRVDFHDIVEQAIVVEKEEKHYPDYDDDETADDDRSFLTMKPSARPRRAIAHRNSFSSDSTIAHLPVTTLKSCPEPAPQKSSISWFTSQSALGASLSRSPSTETLRPVKHASQENFLLGEDDCENENVDRDTSWLRWGSEAAARFDSSWFGGNRKDEEAAEKQESMPYAPSSGVFVPFEEQGHGRQAENVDADMDEDEEFRMNYGLFGKVIDTVNTARDIAHVIWNVGWS